MSLIMLRIIKHFFCLHKFCSSTFKALSHPAFPLFLCLYLPDPLLGSFLQPSSQLTSREDVRHLCALCISTDAVTLPHPLSQLLSVPLHSWWPKPLDSTCELDCSSLREVVFCSYLHLCSAWVHRNINKCFNKWAKSWSSLMAHQKT